MSAAAARPALAAVLAAAAGPAWAQAGTYTYVQMSLGVPWALYFVFLAGVSIPFVAMVVLACVHNGARAGAALRRFLRYGLPAILVVVLAVVALYVVNAFEVTHLMQTEKRAGPTLLNR